VIIINKYELMLIVNPGVEAERNTEILERLRATVEEATGKVAGVDEWGKRKLAYEIKGQAEGIYSVVTFTATPQAVAEVERVLGITDDVVRFMTLRLKA
jgi:small subunit ribosomal protein S6